MYAKQKERTDKKQQQRRNIKASPAGKVNRYYSSLVSESEQVYPCAPAHPSPLRYTTLPGYTTPDPYRANFSKGNLRAFLGAAMSTATRPPAITEERRGRIKNYSLSIGVGA